MATSETHHTLTDAIEAFATLRRSYERYWQGLERPEPERERERLRSVFRRLLVDIEGPSNTALAFRVRAAQNSFRAFDELCERRSREPNAAPPALRRREAAASPRAPVVSPSPSSLSQEPKVLAHASLDKTVVGPVPTRRPSPFDPLYETLVAHLQQAGQAAPSKDKFVRQVEAHLDRARAQAPGKALRAELSFDAGGKPQLVVIDASE